MKRASLSAKARHPGRRRVAGAGVLKVGRDFYVLASSLGSRRRVRVLADARSFAVFDAGGDIVQSPLEALGFFHSDTRHLSRFEIRIAGQSPYFLNSYLSEDKAQFLVNLTNPDLDGRGGTIHLPRNSIQVDRAWVLAGPTLVHRILLRNYAADPVEIPLDLFVDVDFADLFEVRGVRRKVRGRMLAARVGASVATHRYCGRDGVVRFTEIAANRAPDTLRAGRFAYRFKLKAGESESLEIRIRVGSEHARVHKIRAGADFDRALEARRAEITASRSGWAAISASNELFDSLLRRSAIDLTSIISHTRQGGFMMAGIPWFATLFGRDSLITALAMLPFNPDIAGRTLRTLARIQGARIDDARDEQPGKIVHETRAGEMAATGEVPFGRYYGSVDSTPLFLWVLGRYVAATGDLALARSLWPNVRRALEWIERYGDSDGDGYVEYRRETPRGLANQGWKDSFDAISHRNGELARAPIALCEVQGYVYAAYLAIAPVATRLGHADTANRLLERSAALKRNFLRDFWLPRERIVALALDGEKKPCRVMASNGAHCMAAGLLDLEQARHFSARLLADDMFSGWGIRTLSADERRYNPMSYHNGSVWPHDNGLAALGLARYRNSAGVLKVLQGLFDAAVPLGSASLPELFCGFARKAGLGPVPYPVACYPQAWSAASVFMILQAMLGLEVNGLERRVIVDSPLFPPWLQWLRIERLRVGDGSVSMLMRRTAKGTAATEILEKRGAIVVDVRR